MSKRSELRRIQRESEKKQKRVGNTIQNLPLNVLSCSEEQVMRNFNLSSYELKTYLERMEKQIKKDLIAEYQKKLYMAEDYIAVGYLVAVIYALKMSRKSREHTKDLIQRMLDNLNIATEYVERVGIEQAYKNAHEDFDITIEFDSIDINKEFKLTEEG